MHVRMTPAIYIRDLVVPYIVVTALSFPNRNELCYEGKELSASAGFIFTPGHLGNLPQPLLQGRQDSRRQ